MGLKLGTTDVAAIYLGSTSVTALMSNSVAAWASTPTVPVITAVSILGSAVQGETLTASVAYTGFPSPTLTYQWKAGGVNISGATASTVVLTGTQVGAAITVTVGASNTQGTATPVTSSATSAVAAASVAPSISSVTISDTTPSSGDVLSVTVSASGNPTPTYTYVWKADGGTVGTASTYTVQDADAGKAITCTVTASNGVGSPATLTSGATSAVVSIPAWVQVAANGLQPDIALEFANSRYYGSSVTDVSTVRSAGTHQATDSLGSTVTFSANQVRLTDLGIYFDQNDIMTLGGALAAKIQGSSGTLLIDTGVGSIANGYPIIGGDSGVILIGCGPNNQSQAINYNGSATVQALATGGNNYGWDNHPQGAALRFDSSGNRTMVLGGGGIYSGTGGIGARTTVYIGRNGGGAACVGTIRALYWFDRQLTDAEMQQATALSPSLRKYKSWGDSMSGVFDLVGTDSPDPQRYDGAVGGEDSAQVSARFVADATATRDRRLINVIWCGHNRPDTVTTLSDLQAMIPLLTGEKRYLILLPTISTSFATNSAQYAAIVSHRAAIVANFPAANVLDAPAILNAYAPSDTNVTSGGYTPSTLLVDSIHLNATGKGLIQAAIRQRQIDNGWIPTPTSLNASDTTPNAFTFTDVTGATLSTVYTSNTITVSGINAASAISITGGTYSINGGTYTSASGTVVNGDTVTVKATSSGSNSTAVNAVLTIGGVSDTYTVTTAAAADTTPDAFTFTDITNATLSTLYTSNTITVTGINASTAISITGGTYSINGGSYTASSGTVVNNDTVSVRVTSSGTNSTAVNAVLTIGGVSDTYTVTTTAGGASNALLREDGSYILREDNTNHFAREA